MSVSNAAVCHARAHGNAAQGGNLSTDGKRLTSYSTDIAYNTGRGLVFITADGFTPTTKSKQLPHARRAIEFWVSRARVNTTGYDLVTDSEYPRYEPWHRNGHRVQLGAFQLDRIEADGTAYAGCHKFNVAELDRLADVLL